MATDDNVSRLTRLSSILTLLKSKRILTATEIAKKFAISTRTVYRDIRALEDSGVPVVMVEGKGYSLIDGYTVPPLMFTEAELNALITAEHIIGKTKDASLIKHYQDAVVKIKSLMRNGLKEKTELLAERMLIIKREINLPTSSSLSALQSSITNQQVTKIIYRKPDGSEATTRFIEPQAFCYLNDNWILIAWCRLRNDFRAFRIDRMEKIEYQDTTFKKRDFSIEEYLKHVL